MLKVFISCSSKDLAWVHFVARQITSMGSEVYSWDESKVGGERRWPYIFKLTENSDCLLALITKSAITNFLSVDEEVGYARKIGRFIIPLVEKGIGYKQLGFLQELTSIHF